jgi:hypothetical protein
MSGQTGYLRADGISLIEQSGLPSYAEVANFKPSDCHTRAGGSFAWALRDPPGDAGVGRVRALLLARCGMAEGREGPYTTGRAQLLVYGDDGLLELTADVSGAALLDWTRGGDGPKLARAVVTREGFGASELTAEAAAPLAAR